MAGITVTQGTQTNVKTTTIGTQEYQHVVLNIGTSADSPFTNTLGTVQNLNQGTLTVLAKGTIANGTVQTIGIRHPDAFGTVVTSGTSTLGTIKAAVAGSAIYVTSLLVSVGTASNVEVASGGTSTPIIGTMYFSTNGGVAAMPWDPPLATASGSALVYKQSVNGPLTITCTGYVD